MTPSEKNALEALMLERECEACLYFIEETKEDEEICRRGIDNCILDEFEREDEEERAREKADPPGACSKCSYGKERPCVGMCFREVKSSWRKGRKAK